MADPRTGRQRAVLIGLGVIKKVVFADFISVNLVDRVFDDPASFTTTEVIIALYGFTLQIYADFSGYTDVARGSALLFGIELPENFDRPYRATSIAGFWRRWHITLSSWLRDYLYFPLGGSRLGELRTYINLWITLFLIGMWHGASWTFVIYGNLQAFAVMLNRYVVRRRAGVDAPLVPRLLLFGVEAWVAFTEWARGGRDDDPFWLTVLKVLMTLQFVVFSRILFRATSLDNALDICGQLGAGTTSTMQVSNDVWRILFVGFYLHYAPRSQLEWIRARFVMLRPWMQGAILALIGMIVLVFVSQQTVPFIYFQF